MPDIESILRTILFLLIICPLGKALYLRAERRRNRSAKP